MEDTEISGGIQPFCCTGAGAGPGPVARLDENKWTAADGFRQTHGLLNLCGVRIHYTLQGKHDRFEKFGGRHRKSMIAEFRLCQ